MANMRNKWEFYGSILEALGVDYTDAELKNNETLRAKLLEGLGVEHTYDDVNQYPLWREKLVEGVGNMSGGGGSSDFSTAEVTVNGKPTFFVAEVASLTENGLQGTCRKSPSENSFTVVLYQGSTIMQGVKGITPSFSIPTDETNILLDESNGWYVITGDCTITIS